MRPRNAPRRIDFIHTCIYTYMYICLCIYILECDKKQIKQEDFYKGFYCFVVATCPLSHIHSMAQCELICYIS